MLAPGTVLLHDNASGGPSRLFARPRAVLTTRVPGETAELLRRAEEALSEGAHVAGFLSYELGLCFEERLAGLLPAETAFPLVWLGLFDTPREMSADEVRDWLKTQASEEDATITAPVFAMSRADYGAAFRRVKDYIGAGDVYQVNLTMRGRFALSGDPVALYRNLCRNQPVAHGALIATGKEHILSFSPELFVERHNGHVVTRPMKGTVGRGRTAAEDAALAEGLQADEKSRAENLMIVDLLRNDLGRVAEMGSVSVPKLFEVETYRSFHAMTSTITARLQTGTRFGDVLRAMFPCGSVTGAPKIRAMEIIDEVEAGLRGLYCGSIGHAAPGGDLSFNVAIRTAIIGADGTGAIATGGGIVADSEEEAEYQEALLKLRFFEPGEALGLIETLLWNGESFTLLDRHMQRLEGSARYFGFGFNREAAEAALQDGVAGKPGALRVRLMLGEDGIAVTSTALTTINSLRFRLVPDPVHSGDRFLYHKTTRRKFYDRAREVSGVDEVLFRNERGELTEGSFTNLFVQSGGRLLTPALDCGLLPGTFRAELLATGKAEEAVLTLSDLERADAVYLGNSVRDLIPAEWVRESAA